MKSFCKILMVVLTIPGALLAQPGVRMSADFLPLEVGNRWVYDVFNEGGQKTGTLEFAVQDYRIVGGRSFYMLTQFPFAQDAEEPRCSCIAVTAPVEQPSRTGPRGRA